MTRLFDIPKGFETKMSIIRAMDALLVGDISLEVLPVSAICKEASISRKTFYNHFEDKYDAVAWYYAFLLRDSSICDIGRSVTCEEGLVSALEAYYGERDFMRKAFKPSDDYESLFNVSVRQTDKGIRDTLENYRGERLTPRLDFEISLCSRTLAIAVANWVAGGFVLSPEELAGHLADCVPQELKRTLDAPFTRTGC